MGGLALALLCLALWNWLKPTGPAASNAPAALPPMAALSTPTPIAAPAPASPDSAAVRPAAPPANRSAPGTDARAAAKAPTPPKTPAKRPVEVQSQAQPVAASPKAPTANPSPALSELPQDIRQALPKLVISGSIYSETAAHRMLIINGQVFHEGEKPAPNVELEQIKPKAAVFNFKGQRYSMGY
jgi:general secretion pathway protein B